MELHKFEDWAKQKGTLAWVLAAVKAANRWGEGAELTEAEYDAAVAALMTAPIR